jgi:3,4-dihydroxy 2-butanone 4-phosphate synthase
MTFANIVDAVDALRAGEFVIVVDDAGRENEGDLIMSAQFATPEALAFMVRHTTGIVCVAITPSRLDDLELPLMVAANTESQRTAFTVSVDVKHGTSTGVSASDRSATIRALADERYSAEDFAKPGHVFPLRYTEGGVLRRPGHTEAAVDLARLAGHTAAGALCEIVNDDGSMARMPELRLFADRHGLLIVNIADLIAYRLRTERWDQAQAAPGSQTSSERGARKRTSVVGLHSDDSQPRRNLN